MAIRLMATRRELLRLTWVSLASTAIVALLVLGVTALFGTISGDVVWGWAGVLIAVVVGAVVSKARHPDD